MAYAGSGAAAETVRAVEREGAAEPAISRRPLKICHLAYTFYECDNRVMRYAESLAGRGRCGRCHRTSSAGSALACTHSAASVCSGSSAAHRPSADRGHTCSRFCGSPLKSTLLLAVLQLRSRYDVMHVHNIPDFLVFAAVVPKLMGARIILDIHDVVPELYSGKFGSSERSLTFRALLSIERLSCRFADHVIIANHLWHDKLVAPVHPEAQMHANPELSRRLLVQAAS